MKRVTMVLPLAFLLVTTPLSSQSARPFSIQASGLYAVLIGNAYQNIKSGPGAEFQVRRTFGRGSLGLGIEYTRHGIKDVGLPVSVTVTRIGPFLEPRLVIPISSNAAAPYLAGRLSLVRVSARDDAGGTAAEHATGYTLNGGGGVLVRVGPRVNLDFGATLGYTKFGDLTSSDGGTEPIPLGSGSNLILRAGIVLGL